MPGASEGTQPAGLGCRYTPPLPAERADPSLSRVPRRAQEPCQEEAFPEARRQSQILSMLVLRSCIVNCRCHRCDPGRL